MSCDRFVVWSGKGRRHREYCVLRFDTPDRGNATFTKPLSHRMWICSSIMLGVFSSYSPRLVTTTWRTTFLLADLE